MQLRLFLSLVLKDLSILQFSEFLDLMMEGANCTAGDVSLLLQAISVT
jgi:hypothetical protein